MNVEIGTEAAQFPEKEYINGIFLAVYNWVQFSPKSYWMCLMVHKLCKKMREIVYGEKPLSRQQCSYSRESRHLQMTEIAPVIDPILELF